MEPCTLVTGRTERDLVRANRDGLIIGFMLGIGAVIRPRDKGRLSMMMESSMKESGMTIKLTERARTSTPTKPNTLATG